jgi:hypothetical protein
MNEFCLDRARILFEEKVKMIEEATGRNILLYLEMQVGPKDAEVIYEQMFAFFYSGMMSK